ncbi:MAG: endonuclease Q family protein [Methanoregula sp.]|nr:MAG: endonuclease Q family protein [Methanoregula sp.]
MLANADLHIHSPYSIAVSRSMVPEHLITACEIKGISVLGTGDALHPAWQQAWRPFLENNAGVVVVPTAEVEDQSRVHHLILAEDFSQFDELRDRLSAHSRSLVSVGRPHVYLSGGAIAEIVHETGGMVGPAHAFTPWTAMYAYFDSVSGCYGSEPIDFLELGLSADSSYGAGITDLYGIPFLSNSDAHSPAPEKFAREFNRLELTSLNVPSVLDAVKNGRIVLNAGFFPEEGKYNRTACVRCFTQYSLKEAVRHAWRCPDDGGIIKKGVYDRARELSTAASRPRPPYLHMVPLGQIIRTVEGVSSPHTRKCRAVYDILIAALGNEIEVLTNTPVSEIRALNPKVADAIDALRNGRVTLHPGGGGKYGTFSY